MLVTVDKNACYTETVFNMNFFFFFGLSEILNFAKIQLKFNYWTRFARFYVFLGKYR